MIDRLHGALLQMNPCECLKRQAATAAGVRAWR